LDCRKKNVKPPHISNNLKWIFAMFETRSPYHRKIEAMAENLTRQALNLKIKITI
jgi:hypothetical protein